MKPIRVLYSPLTKKFYATRHYAMKGNTVVVTGEKDDVTQDIARAIVENDVEFKERKP